MASAKQTALPPTTETPPPPPPPLLSQPPHSPPRMCFGSAGFQPALDSGGCPTCRTCTWGFSAQFPHNPHGSQTRTVSKIAGAAPFVFKGAVLDLSYFATQFARPGRGTAWRARHKQIPKLRQSVKRSSLSPESALRDARPNKYSAPSPRHETKSQHLRHRPAKPSTHQNLSSSITPQQSHRSRFRQAPPSRRR